MEDDVRPITYAAMVNAVAGAFDLGRHGNTSHPRLVYAIAASFVTECFATIPTFQKAEIEPHERPDPLRIDQASARITAPIRVDPFFVSSTWMRNSLPT